MNSYEFNFIQDHQAAMLNESITAQWLREARIGQPSMGQRVGQRMAVAIGEALEAAGGWLKRRGSADLNQTGMGRGLPVPQ